MKMGTRYFIQSILCCAILPATLFAAVTWDGGAADGLWTSPLNWDSDSAPTSADDVFVGQSASVSGATSDFSTLEIETGASVIFAVSAPSSKTFDIDGTLDFAGAFRPYGSALSVSSTGSIGANLNWLDLGSNSSMSFVDGASFAVATSIELRGATTFEFELTSTGFDALDLGGLWDGSVTTWSDISVHLDVSAYDTANGAAVVLMDFQSHRPGFSGTFDPVVNITAGASGLTGSLSFNTATSELIYTFDVVAVPVAWDGGAGDGLWTSASNWDSGSVPSSTDKVIVGSSATVTAATATFSSLEIESGASVTFAVDNPAGQVIDIAGILNYSGAFRPYGCALNLSSTGSLGPDMSWLDLGTNSSMSFLNGASFTTPTSLELRGATTLDFVLSAAGFSPIGAGSLYGPAEWDDLTFNIDVSAYDYATNGLSVVLMDFASHASSYTGTFNPTVNIIDGGTGIGAVLSFDALNSQIVLAIDPPGNDVPVAPDQTASEASGTPLAFVLDAYDLESDPLSYTILTGLDYGSLSGTAPNLTYTPTDPNFVGSDYFTYQVNDGEDDSNIGTVTLVIAPLTAAQLWGSVDDAIRNDALNTEWLTSWTEDDITIHQIRYDLGTLVGSQRIASPKIAAYYAYPTSATAGDDLPGMLQIHGGGQRASDALAKFWAQQGYACISINWGGLPLEEGFANTDWDGIAAGFLRDGVAEALHREPLDGQVYSDGSTLYADPHGLNNSYVLNSYAARRALTFLQAQAIVDGTTLGVTGHSMGGKTTVLTSTDTRLTSSTPAVGGSGFLYRDYWGAPGSGRNFPGSNQTWYENVADGLAYWPDIQCATLFLQASNDFNAPFDFILDGMALQDPAVEQRLAVAPHYNHRFNAEAYAARVAWHKSHLTGAFTFPDSAEVTMDLSQADGVPVLTVVPDPSSALAVESVDIYYGFNRDPLIRYWRDAGAIETAPGQWQAACPVFDTDEPLFSYAIVRYASGFDIELPIGYTSPIQSFSIASKVSRLYPADLQSAGILETAEIQRVVDDFSTGFHDWFEINVGNPHYWEYWTRKMVDPSWEGPVDGRLEFKVENQVAGNTLGIKIITDSWTSSLANTYTAVVTLPLVGTNQVSLELSDFSNGNSEALDDWLALTQVGLMSAHHLGSAFETLAPWSGVVPTFADLNWVGGLYTFSNGVDSDWLEANGLPLNELSLLQDADGDSSSNGDEFEAGTDPNNSSSVFKVEASTMNASGDVFLLNWQGVSGKSYVVDFKAALSDQVWTPVETGVSGVEPTTSIGITLDSEQATGFFRVRVE